MKFIFQTTADVGFNFGIGSHKDPKDSPPFDAVSPLEHGYEDQDELTIMASNIEIIIDDFAGGNYDRFKNLLAQYNSQYPFNFTDVLTLTIKKNDVEKFTGILFSCEYEIASGKDSITEYIKLTWTSASEKLKTMSFGNAAILDKLNTAGLIVRRDIAAITAGDAYIYGWDSASYDVLGGHLHVSTPLDGGANTKIKDDLLLTLFKLINPNINLTTYLDWKFYDDHSNLCDFTDLYLYKIFRYITGRWLVKKEPGPFI